MMERNTEIRLAFRSRAAQAVALTRAFEETDRRGQLLSHDARRDATAAALEAGGKKAAGNEAVWLARRAESLTAVLGERFAFLPRLLRFTDPARGLLVPAVLLAFLLGLATNALGPAHRVHVLALPLVGILAWNVAVLLLLFARRFLPLGAWWRAGRPVLLELLEAWSRRAVGRLPARAGRDKDQREVLTETLGRSLRHWLPAVAPLGAARIRRLLHAAAVALLAGVIGGMYLRGVGFAYEASWESTFLDAATVDAMLGAVLAPAAWILDVAVPAAADIEAPKSGDAAPWIHLWAMTAALVAAPRLLLASAAGLRCLRLGRRLELAVPEVYRRRLLAAASTATHRIEVVPYSYHPGAAVSDALRARLHDVFGARAEVRVRSTVEYGTPAEEVELTGGRGQAVVLNLAQTPEVEVHGEFLRALRDDLPDGQVLLVVVDGSLYRERVAPGKTGEERIAERRRSWDRVLQGAGLKAIHLDLRRAGADESAAALIAGAWPSGSLG